MKTKVKSYNGKIDTNLQDNDIPNEGEHCVCLSVILIDSVIKMGRTYYSKVFLEDCKYAVKKSKMIALIDTELKFHSDDSVLDFF